ncbi:RHS repeat-associated core domain-containing protein [Solilutibacter silvestris]|uniref:RHS repeat-associated core domain-containing protein n=1 Tax=Solilutibacter silvestris TaxID=1645665 RepID=UPI003D33D698
MQSEQEYSKQIDRGQALQGSGAAPFGEAINLRDGGMQFRQVDIDLPGIGPSIQIARTFRVRELGKAVETSGNMLGDWELEIPRFKTMTSYASQAKPTSPTSWQVAGSNNARCTYFSAPSVISTYYGTHHWASDDWWNGYQLVDGQGNEEQVFKSPSITPTNGGTYVAISTGRWEFSCLSSTANGMPGEAFLGLAPDGTKYWFNYLVYTTADSLNWNDYETLDRRYGAMLVTRVEDRFGNYVNYQYSGGLLTQIDGSDGRHVDITRSGTSIVIGAGTGSTRRTWSYETTNGSLTRVVQPDGSAWSYSFAGLSSAALLDDMLNPNEGTCNGTASSSYSPTATGSATAPSGVTESFTFKGTPFGRSNVPRICYGGETTEDGFTYFPLDWRSYAITQRTFSGPGISTQTWNYSYSASNASWQSQCGAGCVTTVWTDVVDPAGVRQRSIFSNKFDETENLLLRQENYASNGTLMKSADFGYATFPAGNGPNPYPWPSYIGGDMRGRVNAAVENRWTPLRQTTISQDGVTFSSYVNSYDTYARPASVGKWSSLGYSRTDVTEYYNDTTHWVLGQIKRHYNADTNLVDTRNEYDANTALMLQTYAFEKLKATMTYNANGTLATSKDGNNNTTTFSNWKRGIPQAVQYADGASVSAIVNDNGWITAVTDENGFSTGYGYDAMGRLASIVYPNEPTFNYNTKTINFQATAGEWVPPGIQTGQWRRYEAVGNHITLTYYDAMWRPVLVLEYDSANVGGTNRYTKISYDVVGRKIFQSYPSTIVSDVGVRTNYDALSRVMQVQQDSELGTLTTTTEYLIGFQVRTTNPRGYQTTNGYQVYDQPSYDQVAWSAQPENKDVTITRNFFGMPLTIKQADHVNSAVSVTRSYSYDGYMQLCKTLEPETGATLMDYDAAGNLAWNASGLRGGDYDNASECTNSRSAAYGSGRRVDRSYDARNRVLTLSFPDGVGNQNWQYTPDGLPSQITAYNSGSNGTPVVNAYSYNHRRLLGGETSSQSGWYSWGIGYGYDANASLAANTYPDGFSANFTNNALGQPTQVTSGWGTLASGVSYYPNGAISQFTYGNGIVHTMTQNARQMPARSMDSGGVLNDVYNYDANGNVGSTIDELVGAGNYSLNSRWMTYDGLDRLTGAGSGSFGGTDNWHRYTYNALDNITSWKLAGVKDYANYIYDGTNRLTQINNTAGSAVVALSYDAQGNLQNKSGQNYSFDYGNRLRETTGKDYYRYDGLGRRVMNWNPTQGSILSVYSSSGQLMFQQDQRQTLNIPQIYLGGSVLARLEYNYTTSTGQLKYEHTDALGSPVAITNQAGQVIERTQYEPYGNVIGRANNDRVGYTGHVMDSQTGLTYMQQRYYDPTIGRFLSTDPVQADASTGALFNRYDYAYNNPYKFSDPDGRLPEGPGDPYRLSSGYTGESAYQPATPNTRKSMTTSQVGLDFIKDWEGWNGTYDKKLGAWVAKDDGFGNGTIGWGHNCGKCEDFRNGITKEQAEVLLRSDLGKFEKSVNDLGVAVSQQKFDALVSFAFNVRGYAGSTLFKNVVSGVRVTEQNFTAYGHARVRGKLVEIRSLMARRRSEYDIYANGHYDSSH